MQVAHNRRHWPRREFLAASAAALAASALDLPAAESAPEPIIDIHQHTHYHERTDEQLFAHQRAMGVTTTILLPAGHPVDRPSTNNGKYNGLQAMCGPNESVVAFAKEHPGEFVFGSNEVTDLPEARAEIEKYLKLGAKIIAEQKFSVECDSAASQELYRLAQDYGVPILLHFQHQTYKDRKSVV